VRRLVLAIDAKGSTMRWALITGGTDGIGRAVAGQLAAGGHGVLIVGSDNAKGIRAQREIRRDSDNSEVHFLPADLTLVGEAHRLADEVTSRCDRLHYLVHSAGMVRGRRVLTVEGVESNFAVNYLSRFALTNRLLPVLQAASLPGRSARIVLVGGAVRKGPIHYDDISLAKRFTTIRAIKQFQQANNVFTVQLARRLHWTANPVTITCLQPGVVATNIRRRFPRWMRWAVALSGPLVALPPDRIAASIVTLLGDPAFEGVGGAHFSHIRRFKPARVPAAHRPAEGAKLWALSEHLVAHAQQRTAPQDVVVRTNGSS
jgi:NAD(P)-dependent dehydrogenase (short-subunit alcohol dehydrogenase family)